MEVELTWQVESFHECIMLACRLQTAVAASAGVPASSVNIFSAASSGSNFLVGLQVFCTNLLWSKCIGGSLHVWTAIDF